MVLLFHVSDLHFGSEDRGALAAFAAAIRADRPDAVLLTGDLTMRARSAEFAAAAAWLGGLGVPVAIDPGNHDLPYYNPLKRLFRPYRRAARLAAALERPPSLPGVAIVPLRTTSRFQWRINQAEGVVHAHRIEAAAAALAAIPRATVKIVTCHHPLAGERTRGGTRAIAALAAAGADLILSGHAHDPFDREWSNGIDTVRLVGAGTLSERTRHGPPSYNAVSIDGRAIGIETRPLA